MCETENMIVQKKFGLVSHVVSVIGLCSLKGWTSAEKVKPAAPKMPCTVKFFNFFLEEDGLNTVSTYHSHHIFLKCT